MIPKPYLALFRADVEDAVTLAEAGDLMLGFEILDMGLACVEAPPDEPWAGELISLYQRAMVRLHEAPELLLSELVPLDATGREQDQEARRGTESWQHVTDRSRVLRERVTSMRRAAEERCIQAAELRIRAGQTMEAARATRMEAQRTREKVRALTRRH